MAARATAKRSTTVRKLRRKATSTPKKTVRAPVKKSATIAETRRASTAATPRTAKAVKAVRGSPALTAALLRKLSATAPQKRNIEERDHRLLHSIRVRNLLSFGPETTELSLQNFNVLVGLNSSGKSNLIEVLRLLQSLPNDIAKPIEEGGGIEQWLHKAQAGGKRDRMHQEPVIGEVCAIFGLDLGARGEPPYPIRTHYQLGITEHRGHEVKLHHEQLDIMRGNSTTSNLTPLFKYRGGNVFEVCSPIAGASEKREKVERDDLQQEQSYFHRMQTNRDAPLLVLLSRRLEALRVYSDWTVGRSSTLRGRQSADEIGDRFREDLSNIASVVSQVVQDPDMKDKILHEMARHTNCVKDFGLSVTLGYADVFFREGQKLIPAKRMSDGALRLFFLLAVLCDPDPPPLICIEEPEIAMHADVIPALVDLMEEAAQRTQLIVTTHSEVLIDSLTHNPEALVICEQVNGQTEMSRLDMGEVVKRSGRKNADKGLAWLWQRGFLGGTK